jgi:hypothetical protein
MTAAPAYLDSVLICPHLAPVRADVERTQERADRAWDAWSAAHGEPDRGEPDPALYFEALAAQEAHDQALARYYEEESALYPTIIA